MPAGVCLKVKPVGKPDAGDSHILFDERGWETKSRQAGLRRRLERDAMGHREPKATAPVLDSTISVTSKQRQLDFVTQQDHLYRYEEE